MVFILIYRDTARSGYLVDALDAWEWNLVWKTQTAGGFLSMHDSVYNIILPVKMWQSWYEILTLYPPARTSLSFCWSVYHGKYRVISPAILPV